MHVKLIDISKTAITEFNPAAQAPRPTPATTTTRRRSRAGVTTLTVQIRPPSAALFGVKYSTRPGTRQAQRNDLEFSEARRLRQPSILLSGMSGCFSFLDPPAEVDLH